MDTSAAARRIVRTETGGHLAAILVYTQPNCLQQACGADNTMLKLWQSYSSVMYDALALCSMIFAFRNSEDSSPTSLLGYLNPELERCLSLSVCFSCYHRLSMSCCVALCSHVGGDKNNPANKLTINSYMSQVKERSTGEKPCA